MNLNREIWKFKREHGYLINTKVIESASELMDCVDYIWKKIWVAKDPVAEEEFAWFRGVGCADYKLIPSIYRKKVWKYNWQAAHEIRGEFPRRAAPFIDYCRFYSEGELYHIMQHYGLPTRLLDWTEGMLFALFFSVRDIPTGDDTHSPCVWMLNPWWLNEKSAKKRNLFYSHFEKGETDDRRVVSPYFDEKKLPPYPIAVLPPHIDKRIIAQKSVFSIQGRKEDGFSDLCLLHRDAQLAKLCLDGSKIDKFKDQLITLGIAETSVFPDLEGLAREIRLEYDMT
jgi:hypothetical protein